jgi:hypothetical protein
MLLRPLSLGAGAKDLCSTLISSRRLFRAFNHGSAASAASKTEAGAVVLPWANLFKGRGNQELSTSKPHVKAVITCSVAAAPSS